MSAAKSTSRVEKFTKANVRKLIVAEKPGRKITEAASPLVLKITSTGGQWIVVKSVAGKIRTFTPKDAHGSTIANTASIWPPEQARQWAVGIVGSIAKGEAPQPQRRPRSTTFAVIAKEHLADYATKARPTSVTARDYGIRYALPTLGHLGVADITSDHLEAMHAALDTPSKRTKAHISVVEVLAFAMRRKLVAANVAKSVEAPKRPASRDRYPDLVEIRAIDEAAAADGTAGSNIIRLIIRTGLRREAAASLTWPEVDLNAGKLTLQPAPGRKITAPVTIPLGDSAVALLRETPRHADTDLIFPGTDRKGRPIVFRSWQWIVQRLRAASAIDGWSPHDFRRSLVSLTAEHAPGVDLVSLDRLLQHTGGSTLGTVAGIYQRGSMLPQMRVAIAAWDGLLARALGDNVVSIGQAKA